MLAPAVMDRITLVINHVLSGEPVATDRMRAHAGRRVRLHLDGWPALLPPPPELAFAITPAGLFEWTGRAAESAPAEVDLTVRVDASNPARLAMQALGGHTPPVDIQGNSQLATDVDWLLRNLRWDVAADLERLLGAGPAHEIHRLGRMLAQAMRSALDGLRRARDGLDRGRM